MASSCNSPSPRGFPFVASRKNKVYLWGGQGDDQPEAVFIYNVHTESWTKKTTKGPHPPTGLHDGGCSISDKYLYIYGGSDDSSYSGSLYQLNIFTWTWKELSNGSAGGPGRKVGCRMISYQDQLWIVGGYYGPRARYNKGFTDEIHIYDTRKGETLA